MEKDIVARMTNQTEARRSTPITWEELDRDEGCRRVYLSERKEYYKSFAESLRGIRAVQLPELAKDPEGLGRRLTKQKLFKQQYAGLASSAVGTALLLALQSRGWTLRKQPGRPLCVSKGDHALEADGLLADLHQAKISPEEWTRRCADYGIAELDLGLVDPSP